MGWGGRGELLLVARPEAVVGRFCAPGKQADFTIPPIRYPGRHLHTVILSWGELGMENQFSYYSFPGFMSLCNAGSLRNGSLN